MLHGECTRGAYHGARGERPRHKLVVRSRHHTHTHTHMRERAPTQYIIQGTRWEKIDSKRDDKYPTLRRVPFGIFIGPRQQQISYISSSPSATVLPSAHKKRKCHNTYHVLLIALLLKVFVFSEIIAPVACSSRRGEAGGGGGAPQGETRPKAVATRRSRE